jgi:hypothetical protein
MPATLVDRGGAVIRLGGSPVAFVRAAGLG